MDDALAQQNLGYALFKRIVRLVCASQDMFFNKYYVPFKRVQNYKELTKLANISR